MNSNQSQGVELFAIVTGSNLFATALYDFQIGGWSVQDQKTHLRFTTILPPDFDESHVYSAVNNLENLLIAMFVNDHVPRRIGNFDHPPGLSQEDQRQLRGILGQCGDPLHTAGNLEFRSVGQSALTLMRKLAHPAEGLPSVSAIKEWLDLLTEYGSVAAGIALIQESFAALSEFATRHRYHDYLALSKVVILMVSGLESLFFHNSDDQADISFKFRLIGAIFYERFVTEDFLKSSSSDGAKLPFTEMKRLLRRLYDIRSMIAHGKARGVLKGNQIARWNEVFDLLHVGRVDSKKKSDFLGHIVLALSLLQAHILALIVCSKKHLAKGAKIVDELFAS